ncbi:hypothetical protein [Kitasatospora sp. NPDC088783]|uniref:hypothetical protein n=1 Tax=Kitasatospora sp. NPDC088783 TaxID=3364077 RepID=UPI00382BC069
MDTELDLDIGAGTPLTPEDRAAAQRLVDLALRLEIEDDHLDEDVHAAASTYASDACNSRGVADLPLGDDLHEEGGRQAAEVNNGGLHAQIAYLVGQFDPDEVERMIRQSA